MNFLLYYERGDVAGERLFRIIELLIPKAKLTSIHTIESLTLKLCQPAIERLVTVLVARDRALLLCILSLKELLLNMPIILILPDDENETLALGHTLRPRFISFCDGDFIEVAAVLSRMAGKGIFLDCTEELLHHERYEKDRPEFQEKP